MYSLVINAPKQQVGKNNKKSFKDILYTGIGQGYALNKSILEKIQIGCKVIVLSKDQRLRAEGTLIELIPTEMTNNHIQRFDVKIENLKNTQYKSEDLNRNGVNAI